MNPYKPIIPDDKQMTPGTYAAFHFYFKGHIFINEKGQILSKLDVWCEHHKSPDMIRMIMNGTARQYHAVDKPGWHGGVLV